jgi:hypothetical protein
MTSTTAARPLRTPTVLVVDDEPSILDALAEGAHQGEHARAHRR